MSRSSLSSLSTTLSTTNLSTTSFHPSKARLTAAAAVLGCAFALSGCGTSTSAAETPPVSSTASSAAPSVPAVPAATGTKGELTLDSGWVKAGSGMTAAFGTITNHSSAPVTIVKGSSDKAGVVQLHTMQKQADGTMKMIEKEGGFVIPAGGRLSLSPGGNHIMLMDLSGNLENGEKVSLDMVATDGTRFDWSVPVRAFAGAQETYAPSMPSMTGMTGMTDTPKPRQPSMSGLASATPTK